MSEEDVYYAVSFLPAANREEAKTFLTGLINDPESSFSADNEVFVKDRSKGHLMRLLCDLFIPRSLPAAETTKLKERYTAASANPYNAIVKLDKKISL